jgi:hypothetical protein
VSYGALISDEIQAHCRSALRANTRKRGECTENGRLWRRSSGMVHGVIKRKWERPPRADALWMIFECSMKEINIANIRNMYYMHS